MLHLIDQAANRLQVTGRSRMHRQGKPEPRWPASAAVIAAIVFQWKLPQKLILRSDLHYVLLALEGALLVGLFAANPLRIEKRSKPIRAASIALIVLMTAANAASAVLLVRAILTNQLGPKDAALRLLLAGAAIWGTNVVAFALWYWEFDRGGPVSRLEGTSPYPDLLFTQMTAPELTPPGWGPHFVDYLYLSFTNATAFSPDRCLASRPVGEADDARPVGGLAATRRPRHRPCREHPALTRAGLGWGWPGWAGAGCPDAGWAGAAGLASVALTPAALADLPLCYSPVVCFMVTGE